MMTETELAALLIGESRNPIDKALIEWACEGSDYEAGKTSDMIRNVVRQLEQTNCAGCSAPAGLIYNDDLYDKAREWGAEIDEALADYGEETGVHFTPPDNSSLSIGLLVWFAVEWHANRLARLIALEHGIED